MMRMIGPTISLYRILEKVGEVHLVPQSGTDEPSSSLVVAFAIVHGSSQFTFVGKGTA